MAVCLHDAEIIVGEGRFVSFAFKGDLAEEVGVVDLELGLLVFDGNRFEDFAVADQDGFLEGLRADRVAGDVPVELKAGAVLRLDFRSHAKACDMEADNDPFACRRVAGAGLERFEEGGAVVLFGEDRGESWRILSLCGVKEAAIRAAIVEPAGCEAESAARVERFLERAFRRFLMPFFFPSMGRKLPSLDVHSKEPQAL